MSLYSRWTKDLNVRSETETNREEIQGKPETQADGTVRTVPTSTGNGAGAKPITLLALK